MNEDIDKEIERLKGLKTQISSKINITNEFEEKENLEEQLSAISSQIKLLEKFRKK